MQSVFLEKKSKPFWQKQRAFAPIRNFHVRAFTESIKPDLFFLTTNFLGAFCRPQPPNVTLDRFPSNTIFCIALPSSYRYRDHASSSTDYHHLKFVVFIWWIVEWKYHDILEAE